MEHFRKSVFYHTMLEDLATSSSVQYRYGMMVLDITPLLLPHVENGHLDHFWEHIRRASEIRRETYKGVPCWDVAGMKERLEKERAKREQRLALPPTQGPSARPG